MAEILIEITSVERYYMAAFAGFLATHATAFDRRALEAIYVSSAYAKYNSVEERAASLLWELGAILGDRERKNSERIARFKIWCQQRSKGKQESAGLRTIFDALTQKILVKDRYGRFIFVNKAFAKSLGMSPDEIIGKNDYDLYSQDLADKYTQNDREVMATGERLETREQNEQRDGTRISVQVVKVPFGQTEGVVVIFWDVTEQIRLREMNALQMRFAIAGELLAGLAHNIRNPLAAIAINIGLLLHRLSLGDNAEGTLRTIERLVGQIDEMIGRALLLVKTPGEEALVTVSTNNLLGEIYNLFSEQFKRKNIYLIIKSQSTADDILFWGHPIALLQAISNIVNNAYEMCSPGSQVTITCCRKTLNKEDFDYLTLKGLPEPRNFSEGSQVVEISIADTGPGMGDIQNRVLEPFVTTKPQGTGLGLSSAFRAIKSSNGDLELISAPGKGANFILRFRPSHETAAVLIGRQQSNEEPVLNIAKERARDVNILVVDDLDAPRLAVKGLLEDFGFRCSDANSFASAEEYLKLCPREFDVIIADYHLGEGKFGTNLLINGKKKGLIRKDALLIVISGTTDQRSIIEEIRTLGAVFIGKPFKLSQLLNPIAKHFRAKGVELCAPALEPKMPERTEYNISADEHVSFKRIRGLLHNLNNYLSFVRIIDRLFKDRPVIQEFNVLSVRCDTLIKNIQEIVPKLRDEEVEEARLGRAPLEIIMEAQANLSCIIGIFLRFQALANGLSVDAARADELHVCRREIDKALSDLNGYFGLTEAAAGHISLGLAAEDNVRINEAIDVAVAQQRLKEPDALMQAALDGAKEYLANHEQGELARLIEESEFRFVIPDSDVRAHAPPYYIWYASEQKFVLATTYEHQGRSVAIIPYALIELLSSQGAVVLLAQIFSHEAKHIHNRFVSPQEHDEEVKRILEATTYFVSLAGLDDEIDRLAHIITNGSPARSSTTTIQLFNNPDALSLPTLSVSIRIKLLAAALNTLIASGKVYIALNSIAAVRAKDQTYAMYAELMRQMVLATHYTNNESRERFLSLVMRFFTTINDFATRGGLRIGTKTGDRVILEQELAQLFVPTFTKVLAESPRTGVGKTKKPPLVIVGILGRRASGKTTLAKHLAATFGFKHCNVFTKPKEIAMYAYGLTYTEMFDLKTEESRTVMNVLCDLINEIEPNAYIDYALGQIVNYQPSASEAITFTNRWVLGDLRLELEVDAVRAIGGQVWKIEGPVGIRGALDEHRSEAEVDAVPSHKIDIVINNSGTLESVKARANAIARAKGFDIHVKRIGFAYETEFSSFANYISYIKDLKEEALKRSGEYSRNILGQIEDLALQFAAEDNMIDRTPSEIAFKKARAQAILRGIYAHNQLRQEFIEFALANQIQDSYRNRQTPLYIVAANWLLGRLPWDRRIIEEHPSLFSGNATVSQHPWFGNSPQAALPMTVTETATLSAPDKQKLKLLLSGSAEKLHSIYSAALFLKKLLETVAPGFEIEIHADDINFPERIHLFDEHGNYRSSMPGITFDANGVHEAAAGIRLIKVGIGDPKRDVLAPEFMPQEKYDILVSSRMAVQYCYNTEALTTLRGNLIKCLNENGILLFDTKEANHAEITQCKNGIAKTSDCVVPYQDINYENRYIGRISNSIRENRSDKSALVLQAYQLAEKYATRTNPVFEKAAIAQLLGIFGEDTTAILSVLLSRVPKTAIREAFATDTFRLIESMLDEARCDLDMSQQTTEAKTILGLLYRRMAFPVAVASKLKDIAYLYRSRLYTVTLVEDERHDYYIFCSKNQDMRKITQIFVLEGFFGNYEEHLQKARIMQSHLERDRSENMGGTFALAILKGGVRGGRSTSIRRDIEEFFSKLGYEVYEGAVIKLEAKDVLRRWGETGIMDSLKAMENNPHFSPDFIAEGEGFVRTLQGMAFNSWLLRAQQLDPRDKACQELRYAMFYLASDSQVLYLKRLLRRKLVLSKSGIRERVARRLLGGKDIEEVDEQDFVKMLIGYRDPFRAEKKTLRRKIVARELTKGKLYWVLQEAMERYGLGDQEQVGVIANAIHAPSSEELPLEIELMSDTDLEQFTPVLNIITSRQKRPDLSCGISHEDEASIENTITKAFTQNRVIEPDTRIQIGLKQATHYLRELGQQELAALIEQSEFKMVMPDADINNRSPPHYLWYQSDNKFVMATVIEHSGKRIVLLPYALIDLLLSHNAVELLARIFGHEARHVFNRFSSHGEHDWDASVCIEEIKLYLSKGPLKIVFFSAEVSPFSEAGGQAYYVQGLSRSLAAAGHDVSVISLGYDEIKWGNSEPVTLPVRYEVSIGGRPEEATLKFAKAAGVKHYFLTHPLYSRRMFLGDHWQDYDLYRQEILARIGSDVPHNGKQRFLNELSFRQVEFFCKAGLEALVQLKINPDLVHLNDWQTGLVAALRKRHRDYRTVEALRFFATLFAIHNLGYKGLYSKHLLESTGFGWEEFTHHGLEFHDDICALKGGLVDADVLVPVSPVYAQEIQTTAYGERLEGLLRARSKEIFGILNGIDYADFNPLTDAGVPFKYDADTLLQARPHNKQSLLERLHKLGFGQFGKQMEADAPLIGYVGRLVEQKGMDLIRISMEWILRDNPAAHFVMYGTGGGQDILDKLRELERMYPQRVIVHKVSDEEYDERLARHIFAASDILVAPSRYEPCGTIQFAGFRYGAMVVARNTGGFAASMHEDIRRIGLDIEKGFGFVFNNYCCWEFHNAVQRALGLRKQNLQLWNRAIISNMSIDNSWDNRVKEYVRLYIRAIAIRKATLDREISDYGRLCAFYPGEFNIPETAQAIFADRHLSNRQLQAKYAKTFTAPVIYDNIVRSTQKDAVYVPLRKDDSIIVLCCEKDSNARLLTQAEIDSLDQRQRVLLFRSDNEGLEVKVGEVLNFIGTGVADRSVLIEHFREINTAPTYTEDWQWIFASALKYLIDRQVITFEDAVKILIVRQRLVGDVKDVSAARIEQIGPFVKIYNSGLATKGIPVLASAQPVNDGCGLCYDNIKHTDPDEVFLPVVGAASGTIYEVYANYFPVFPDHFVIANRTHIEQRVNREEILDMLLLLSNMPSFRIFYNGKDAGASIPAHQHFQATTYRFPVEGYKGATNVLYTEEGITVSVLSDYPAKNFIVEGSVDKVAEFSAERARLLRDQNIDVDIILTYNPDSGMFRAIIFARPVKHYRFSDTCILTPGAPEMAGIIVISREENKDFFEALTEDSVRKILTEVTNMPGDDMGKHLSRGITPQDNAPIKQAIDAAFEQGRIHEPDDRMRQAIAASV
ncbi:MAG: DUF4922 domain-containing protein, partial [Candidatus Omnitrophica bacterium]|nr:DUF4922 domain-containing protein [Candidatus Omnitrophota bacterium]